MNLLYSHLCDGTLGNRKRSPVLFIRSFAGDDMLDLSFPVRYRSQLVRYEERLVRALAPIVPAVAVGRPGEPQPELGRRACTSRTITGRGRSLTCSKGQALYWRS
jgi:hypothetical protein